jgi:translation initiation factor IF-3
LQQQRGNRRFPPRKREPEHRINDRIRVPEVRLVGDNIPEIGIYTTPKAIEMAQELGLDLVEIASTANPPVCRIMDYSKFLYDKKKKEKEIKAKTAKTVLKEIRFTSNTDDHDFDFKVKHAEKFLKEGAKVKAYVQFRGRAIMFKERGEIILLKLAKQLEELGSPEALPKLEGKRMIMFINPKPQKAGAKKG